jgi:hypothetical protein
MISLHATERTRIDSGLAGKSIDTQTAVIG